jgi:hypothetical protein
LQVVLVTVSCCIQKFTFACDQKFTTGVSAQSGAQKDLRELGFIGRVFNNGDIAVGMMASDHPGSRRHIHAQALGTDSDFAVAADFEAGALTENKRPPRALRAGPQNKAIILFGQVPGGLRGGTDFPMNFQLVMMFAQLVQQGISGNEIGDVLGLKERRQALLPELMAAFNFAFGFGHGLHPMRTMQGSHLRSLMRFTRGVAAGLNWSIAVGDGDSGASITC